MTTNTNTNTIEHGTCGRCGGEGGIQAFSHVAAGVCFACGGSGRVRVSAKCKAPRGGRSAIDELRSLYLAGRSHTGADRAYWIETITEPYDAEDGPYSTLTGARSLLSALEETEACKVRAAFLALGVSL